FIEGQPIPEAGNAIGEIEGGTPVTGIIATPYGVAGGEQRMFYRSQSDGEIFSAKHAGASNPELKIRRGLKVNFYAIDHRLLGQRASNGSNHPNGWVLRFHKMLSGQLAHPVLRAIGAQKSQKTGQFLWVRLVQAPHVNRLGIVAPQ